MFFSEKKKLDKLAQRRPKIDKIIADKLTKFFEDGSGKKTTTYTVTLILAAENFL